LFVAADFPSVRYRTHAVRLVESIRILVRGVAQIAFCSTLTLTQRWKIEIDYCPQCRGVWLDRGGLDKIIERSMADPARGPGTVVPQAPQPLQQQAQYVKPQYDSHHALRNNHQSGHQGYQKKSIWKELFD